MLQIVSWSMSDLSWQFHQNSVICFFWIFFHKVFNIYKSPTPKNKKNLVSRRGTGTGTETFLICSKLVPSDKKSLPGTIMMTSSNGNIFPVTGHLWGNSPISGEFPAQRPVTRSFDIVFDLRLNKPLYKQSRDWWFETLSRPLWRHRNGWPGSISPYGVPTPQCVTKTKYNKTEKKPWTVCITLGKHWMLTQKTKKS